MNTPNKSHIPVFLASNDKFAPFVATTMASILANTQEYVDFYVLDSGISEKNRQKICDTRQYFDNFSVRFIPVDCDKEFGDLPRLKHISRDMYSRFLIPDILPDCEKAIYSDVDVAFVDDIKKLYNEDLGDKIIGAVPTYGKDLTDEDCFCSGLLLINCKKWNEQRLGTKVRQTAEEIFLQHRLRLPDMDILNMMFYGNYAPLDRVYCLIPKYVTKYQDNCAVILHYSGGGLNKPWNNKQLHAAAEFWRYVPMTAFAADIETIYRQFQRRKKIKNFFHAFFNIHNREIAGQKFKVVGLLGREFKFRRK